MNKRAIAKRNAIAEKHLALVVSIARKVHSKLPPSFDLVDLIQTGNIALLRAAERYDPRAHGGTPFSAFARHSIRGAIIESVRRNRYVENTRESIDDPGAGGEEYPRPADGGERDLKHATEAARALTKMATAPTIEISIDRIRLNRRLREAISWLPPLQRKLIAIRYGPDEPSPREVARRMGLRLCEAEELHARAIAGLQTRFSRGPWPLYKTEPAAA